MEEKKMERYIGQLGTDVYGVSADESKVAHLSYTKEQACAADADGLLDGTALTAEVQTVTEFLNDMPYARNVQVVASDAATTKITVHGTNLKDEAISEELTLNGTDPVVGTKAFKTVTSVVLPIATGTETVDIGWGDAIGLPYTFDVKVLCFATQAGVFEATAPTLAIDDNEIEKNTITLATALHDEKAVDVYLVL
jgi:hypothetical protein